MWNLPVKTSAWGLLGHQQFVYVLNDVVMSTQNYYFPYRYIVSEYPNITKHFNKEQYERAPTFDLFAIGTIIRNLFALDRPLDSILHR